MKLMVVAALTTIGAPVAAGYLWTRARRSKETTGSGLIDGDQYEADEMLAAFGTTQDWV